MGFLLFFLAVIPPVVLCLFIKKLDKGVKHSAALLAMLFFAGFACSLPAIALNTFTEIFWSLVYRKATYAYYATIFFFCAINEEALKMLVFWFITKDRVEFDRMYDGIIYSVFASLGFATIENITYVLNFGLEAGIIRAVLPVPFHMFFAVIMGYNFSMWRFTQHANNYLRVFKKNDVFPASTKPLNYKKYLVFSMVLPSLTHWLYNFSLIFDYNAVSFAWILFIYIYCTIIIVVVAKKNKDFILSARDYLLSKRPQLDVYYKKYVVLLKAEERRKAEELEKAKELENEQESVAYEELVTVENTEQGSE